MSNSESPPEPSDGPDSNTYQSVQIGPKTINLPADWDVGSVGDNTYLKGRIGWHGLTEEDHMEEGDYFLVTGTDFEDGRVQWDGCVYVNQEWYERDENIQLEEGDILLTKDGSIGKTALIENLPHEATLNNGIFLIRPLEEAYLPQYMYYILNSKYMDDFIESITAGSTISHLYQKDFVNFRFPLPPISEQDRIATVLSTVDEEIRQTKEIVETSEELQQGIRQHMLSKGLKDHEVRQTKIGPRKYQMPNSWEIYSIEEILADEKKSIRGGPAGGRIKKEDRTNEGYKLYFQENVINSDFSLRGDYITEEKFRELSDMEPIPGDILVTLTGNVGECAVFPQDAERGIYESNVMRIRINQSICEPEFVSDLINESKLVEDQIISMSHGGTRKKLNNQIVKAIEIPVPPLQEQQTHIDIISEFNQKIEIEKQRKALLQELKQGLMQDLLNGKVRTPP